MRIIIVSTRLPITVQISDKKLSIQKNMGSLGTGIFTFLSKYINHNQDLTPSYTSHYRGRTGGGAKITNLY